MGSGLGGCAQSQSRLGGVDWAEGAQGERTEGKVTLGVKPLTAQEMYGYIRECEGMGGFLLSACGTLEESSTLRNSKVPKLSSRMDTQGR